MSKSVFKSDDFKSTYTKIYGVTDLEERGNKFEPVPILKAEIYEPMKRREKKAEIKK